jgi:Sulfite exporter TauE/SafE
MTFSALVAVTLTFVLAGFVKGVIGLGLPTVAMGLLAVVMTPAQAAALLVAPSFLTNVWQAMGPELAPLTRRLWPMLLGICVGVWAGGGLLTADGGAQASIGLGAVLALYGLLGLTSVEFSVSTRLEPWLSPLIGAITGVVTAATGVYMIPSASRRTIWCRRSGWPSRCPRSRWRRASCATARCKSPSRAFRCSRSRRRCWAWCWANRYAHAYAPKHSGSASLWVRCYWVPI